MTYHDALKYLDSLVNYEKTGDFDYKTSLKLERMRSFARRLGNPHEGIMTIHVAGTKGKGSVSSFVNSILMKAGFVTGLYTSPHLISFRERIRINGGLISEEDVAGLVSRLITHIESMEREGERPTYFEICTMIAFLYFRENNVNFMVLETGMGGRLDSTNIITPLVSVITPISYDHTQHLGSTIEAIALEKSGIIKDNSVVVSSPQSSEAFEVIRRVAAEKSAVFYSVDKDSLREKLYVSMEKQVFNLATKYVEYPGIEISLLGDFQAENASAAVLASEGLRHYGIFINKSAISEGLRDARWPGRFEILRKKPLVVVDGAQNGQSAFTLKMSVKDNLRYKKLFLVVGVMRDKDIESICGELSQIADYVITTRAESGRACSPALLKDKILQYKKIEAIETASVKEALDKALAAAGADDAILITGSLYVVGEAMEILAK